MLNTHKTYQHKRSSLVQGIAAELVIYCIPDNFEGDLMWRFRCRHCGHWHCHHAGEGWRGAPTSRSAASDPRRVVTFPTINVLRRLVRCSLHSRQRQPQTFIDATTALEQAHRLNLPVSPIAPIPICRARGGGHLPPPAEQKGVIPRPPIGDKGIYTGAPNPEAGHKKEVIPPPETPNGQLKGCLCSDRQHTVARAQLCYTRRI
jgi:hypothetical protein